jgi:hypothetical protein
MQPLDLSRLSWNDFIANGVFFILEVVLLSILVPVLLRIADHRKWSPARKRVGMRSAFYMDTLDFHFKQLADHVESMRDVLPDALLDRPDAWTDEGLRKQRLVLLKEFREGTERLKTDVDTASDMFVQEMQMLAPAFTAELAARSIEFYEMTLRPRNVALASLNWWIVLLDTDTHSSKIGVPEQQRDMYLECETALRNLWVASGLELPTQDGISC